MSGTTPTAPAAAPTGSDDDGSARAFVRGVVRGSLTGENSGALIVAMLIVIAVFAVLLSDTAFLSGDNFLGIVQQTTTITVMAIPAVFVICAGEIDLSFAAVIPVSGYVLAELLPDYGIVVAVIAALGVGVVVGLVNGAITVFFNMPSFVVTLGTMGVLNGLAQLITDSQSVPVTDTSFTGPFGSGDVGPIPSLVLWTIGAGLVGYLLLNWMPSGKAVLATGANPDAARFSGIRTARVRIGVLVFSGVGGALAGLLYVGQYHGASFDLGSSDLLTVLAAVIIGGTALQGGKGSIVGAVVGSLLLGTLNNGLILLGLAAPEQLVFRGAIIIAAVILSARTASDGSGRGQLAALRRALSHRPPRQMGAAHGNRD